MEEVKNRSPHNPLETPERPEMVIDLQDGTSEQISVIVIHHNQPEYLNLCMQSMHIMSHMNNYEVIVMDNASNQESQDYLDMLQSEGVHVHRQEKNLRWSRAANLGVEVADPGSSYYVFMHADTVVLNPSWLDVLVNASQGRDAGIVGLELQSYYIQKQRVDFIPEWCMLMTKDCWKDCGPWPEDLPLVGMSYIMTLRSQYRGHKPQAMTNNLVHHYHQLCIDPNEYERLAEDAYAIVPRLMQQAQTMAV